MRSPILPLLALVALVACAPSVPPGTLTPTGPTGPTGSGVTAPADIEMGECESSYSYRSAAAPEDTGVATATESDAAPTTSDPTGSGAGTDTGSTSGGTVAETGADTGAGGESSVWVEVEADRRLAVHVDDVQLQCCAEPMGTFTFAGSDVALDFDPDTATIECDCSCRFDFTVRSEPLAAGAYHLDVTSGGIQLGSFDVVVP